MLVERLREMFGFECPYEPVDAEYEQVPGELTLAGLDEDELRRMDPDDRVAALEQAKLDPYDYIYLACG